MAAGRTRFVVAYDIRDAKRLRQVHKAVKAVGWPMQYSVFICDLDPMELLDLKFGLADIIHHNDDQVAFVRLGSPEEQGRECFEFMGLQQELPTSGPVVI